MSRMFRPDPGEMVDRQSILELKLEHCNMVTSTNKASESVHVPGEKGKASRIVERTKVDRSMLSSKEHLYLDELDLIVKHLSENWIPDIADKPEKVEEYDKLYDELSEVNSQLWDLEDQRRILMKGPDQKDILIITRKAEVSDVITTLNDKRAELVQKINSLWGLKTQEKMYA